MNTWSPWPSNYDSRIEDEKENKKDNLSQKIFMQNSIMLEELFKRFVLLLKCCVSNNTTVTLER